MGRAQSDKVRDGIPDVTTDDQANIPLGRICENLHALSKIKSSRANNPAVRDKRDERRSRRDHGILVRHARAKTISPKALSALAHRRGQDQQENTEKIRNNSVRRRRLVTCGRWPQKCRVRPSHDQIHAPPTFRRVMRIWETN
jgi:hypothetical protein